MTPQEELQELLERIAGMALDNIEQHGTQIPVCLAHDHDGQRLYFVADSPDAEDDEPYDFVRSLQAVEQQVSNWARDGKVRAIVLATDVTCTVASDDGPVRTRALKMCLDHELGGGYTAYLTFRMEDGQAVPGELIHEDLDKRFFRPRRPR